MTKYNPKMICYAVIPVLYLALTLVPFVSPAQAQEFMTYCEQYGEYDPDCPTPKPAQKQQSNNAAKSNATSYVELCNATEKSIVMAIVYDQSADRQQFRVNSKRYMAAGWLRIDEGQCDGGFEVGNGQWIYLAFKEPGATQSLMLTPSSYPISGRRNVDTVCVNFDDRFENSSNELSDLTTNCSNGLNTMRVSFGIIGGTNNFTLNLKQLDSNQTVGQ